MNNTSSFRIYYEDTDSGGVVYYANYLKFAERARTELLRGLGINQSKLSKTEGIFFVVRNVDMDLKKPARLDDILDVVTTVTEISGARVKMQQEILCSGITLVNMTILLVCVNLSMKPVRIPSYIKEKLH